MKKLFLSTVAMLSLMSLANAGGKLVAPPDVPSIPVVNDIWSGPYIGAQIGGVSSKTDVDLASFSYKGSYKLSGFSAGVFAGYNILSSSDVLFGVEGDINYISANKTKTVYSYIDTAYSTTEPMYKDDYKLRQYWDASLRVRLGKVIDNKYLPYITGGIAWTKVGANYPSSDSGTVNSKVKKKTLSGWTAGAGVEVKINKNVNARIQYRYSDYGDATFTHGAFKSKIKNFKTHSIRAGISYTFN